MTSEGGISVVDGTLTVFGNSVLTDVHDSIFLTLAKSGCSVNGTFIGVQSDQIGSLCAFPIGKPEYGQDIPFETQFLTVEVRADSHIGARTGSEEDQSVFYTIFLPILEGDFRAVLQGNADKELEICSESGDPTVRELSNGSGFAPIGLIKMFNSGGAVKELNHESERAGTICMKVCGCDILGAHSSVRPKRTTADNEEIEFKYEEAPGLVTLALRIP